MSIPWTVSPETWNSRRNHEKVLSRKLSWSRKRTAANYKLKPQTLRSKLSWSRKLSSKLSWSRTAAAKGRFQPRPVLDPEGFVVVRVSPLIFAEVMDLTAESLSKCCCQRHGPACVDTILKHVGTRVDRNICELHAQWQTLLRKHECSAICNFETKEPKTSSKLIRKEIPAETKP